jgi:Protein of unknown function (DUF3147)
LALECVAEIAMPIELNPSVLSQTKWHEYAIRFFFGGLITAIAGLIAKEFGPVVGGMFLAFPAIFPASATLIEKHEKQRKEQRGLQGTKRGRDAASVDAAGAAMGSMGLFAFALFVWQSISSHTAWLVLIAGTLVWLIISVLMWQIRSRRGGIRQELFARR